MSQALLSVRNLKKYFPMPKPSLFAKERPYLRANDGIFMEVHEGETYGLVGESGCGKSTFGRTVLQLQRPTQGEVVYYGRQTPVIYFTEQAERFIIDNIEAVIAAERGTLDSYNGADQD